MRDPGNAPGGQGAAALRVGVVTLSAILPWPALCLAGGSDLGVRVLPERVYPSIVYRLRLEGAERSGGEPPYWSWSSSAGEILSDGATEVYWKSPGRPGSAIVDVVALGEDGTGTERRARLEVAIHRPDRDGMIFIPAGTFVMGDSWTDPRSPDFVPSIQNVSDKPPHRVFLDGYWIDRHRVTNRQYAAFLQDMWGQGLVDIRGEAVVGRHEGVEIPFYYFRITPRPWRPGNVAHTIGALRWDGSTFTVREGLEEHAVMDVTWEGSKAYALYHGRRLPTEAQWEKAARGRSLQTFPWGDRLPGRYHAHVNLYNEEDILDSFPVGQYSPAGDSPYGVADLMGGFEWVEDWFDAFYYRDNYAPVPLHNPRGPEWGQDHPVRGVSPAASFLGPEQYLSPLSFRYQWVFEFNMGHLFAHSETTFRTVLPLAEYLEAPEGARGLESEEKLPLRREPRIPLPDGSAY